MCFGFLSICKLQGHIQDALAEQSSLESWSPMFLKGTGHVDTYVPHDQPSDPTRNQSTHHEMSWLVSAC